MAKFKSGLVLEELPGRKWCLAEDLVFEGRYETFVVKEGYITDLASVPRVFRSVLPSYGSYTKAAVLHDMLWQISKLDQKGLIDVSRETIQLSRQEYPVRYLVDPVDVDGLFRRAMRLLGTGFVIRWLMWWAVRTAAMATGRIGRMGLSEWLQWLMTATAVFAPVWLPVAGLWLF